MRLHAEWSAEGVRLWLGLDANLHAQLGAIAEQVRRCMFAQGVRIVEFSCNGRPLAGTFTHESDTKEKTWPSAP